MPASLVSILPALADLVATAADTDGVILKQAPTTIARCSKCGIIKKSGQLSCCARGGAWLNNCGDPGDSSFEHTWIEGIEACESKFFIAVQTMFVVPASAYALSVWYQCLNPSFQHYQPLQIS